jgi:hypothetical protein
LPIFLRDTGLRKMSHESPLNINVITGRKGVPPVLSRKNNGENFEDENSRNKIIYDFTRSLPDKKKSKLGKYYTPRHLVEKLHNMVLPYLKEESLVMDTAAGCGAFLESFKDRKTIGRDIDEEAVEMLRTLGFKNIEKDNSLQNVSRKKYKLSKNEHLVIVGNPPYNDWTSKNKKTGKNAKDKIEIEIDEDIKSNDLGVSFLRAFGKLNADVICVLHPLSYLIKESNFKKLRSFAENYYLADALIFSSREFSDTQQTPFPIIIALYLKGKMDYEYIRNFQFEILNVKTKFILKNIETIDGYIRKYPPKKNEKKHSDIGLYMYNIRDLNSLLTSGNLTEKVNFGTHITINSGELYKYAYLNCMKRYFEKDFLFGNLSPIVRKKDLENDEYLRDIFIIDTILNNQKISVFNLKNNQDVVNGHARSNNSAFDFINEYKEKAKNLNSRECPNPYQIFLDFLEDGRNETDVLKTFIKNYFSSLKNSMLRTYAYFDENAFNLSS